MIRIISLLIFSFLRGDFWSLVSMIDFAQLPSPKNCLVLIAHREFSENDFRLLIRDLKGYASFTIASRDTAFCLGDSGMLVKPDVSIYDIDTLKYDILIMVGGPGILLYDGDKRFLPILSHFARKGLITLGISTLVLARTGLLKGKSATTIRDRLAIKELKSLGVIYQDKAVVVSSPTILTAPSVNRKLLLGIFRLLE